MKLFLKVLLALVFWIGFVSVLFKVGYPQTLVQASVYQLGSFFLTLFLAVLFTLNVFLNFLAISFFISLGFIILLLLQALRSLNLVTGILTVIAIWLFVSYFKKNKRSTFTSRFKIPKLQLPNRDNRSKLRNLQRRRS